jgi:ornithine cyclodeaminase
MIGSGPQADTQVEAVCAVRRIEKICICSRTRANAEALHSRLSARRFTQGIELVVCGSVSEATHDADVICTATRATTPVVNADDVNPGTHINAVGSYTLDMRELDVTLLAQARVIVDERAAALSEAGELVDALRQGILNKEDMLPLGELVVDGTRGRKSQTDITVFKSVGLAVQDLCAAARALEHAERAGLGTELL